ncbi:hypothetical protein ACS0TY_021501 [Phlomoides rotata]
MESNFADLSIVRGEEEEIFLDDVDESEDCITQDHCLVGRFLTQQSADWGGEVPILVFPCVGCEKSLGRVTMVLQQSSPYIHLLRKGSIYDLPHGYISEKVGVQLGNFVGKFMEYDKSNHGAAWLSYVRIWVEIDTMSPLKCWKKISQKNGEPFLVHLKYEKLGTFCFVCGLLGHT